MKTRAVGPVFLTRDEVDRWDWPNIAGVPANSGGDLRERMLAVLDEVEELRAKVAMLTEALAVTMSALGDSDGDLHCPTTMKTASAALAATSADVEKWLSARDNAIACNLIDGLRDDAGVACASDFTRKVVAEHNARVRKLALEEAARGFDAQPHLLEKWKDVARILRERALAAGRVTLTSPQDAVKRLERYLAKASDVPAPHHVAVRVAHLREALDLVAELRAERDARVRKAALEEAAKLAYASRFVDGPLGTIEGQIAAAIRALASPAPATTEAKPVCAACGGTRELGTKDRGYGEMPLPCPDCTKPEGA